MGSSSQEKSRGKHLRRKRPDTGETLGLLGSEDLSSLFSTSIAAPTPLEEEEPQGEEIYNSGELDLRSMADAYFRQQEAAAADPVADEMPMVAPAELLIPTVESSSSRGLPIALVAFLGLFLIAGTVFATLMIMDRGDSKAGEQPVADTNQPEAAPEVAPAPAVAAPAPVVIADPAASDSEMVFDPEPAVEKRATRRSKRENKIADDDADEDDDAEEKSRDDVLAELRANKAADKAAAPVPAVVAEPEANPEPAPEKPKCDEVACLVNPSDPCCDKLSGKHKRKVEKAAESELPEKLTSKDVNAGINRMRGRIGACGTKHGFQGVAKLKLTVAGDGTLTRAKVDKGSAEFKSCVLDKLETAKFNKTRNGLTVAYPFVFR